MNLVSQGFYVTKNLHFLLKEGTALTAKKFSLCMVSAGLDALATRRFAFLHKSEQERYETFVYTARKHNFLLGRYAAKKALLKFLDITKIEKDFAISNGVTGAPYFNALPLNISIAHSYDKGVAIVGQAEHPFGIDIEASTQQSLETLDVFSRRELNLFTAGYRDELEKLTILWSSKEALVKLLKIGLTVPLEILELDDIVDTQKGYLEVYYKNFRSMKGFVFKMEEYVISISCYKNMLLPNVVMGSPFFSTKTENLEKII